MSLKKTQSEPSLQTITLQPSSSGIHLTQSERRKSTLPNPSEFYDPKNVLQLILSQPYHAYIGIAPNLRPLIELTIADLRKDLEQSVHSNDDSTLKNKEDSHKLIDEALLRLETNDFEPLEPSLHNFETILKQSQYTHSLIYVICHALIGSFLSGFNTSLLNIPSTLIRTQCNLSLQSFNSLQSMYCVGGLIGSLFAGIIADKYGRKLSLLFANALFMISGMISILYCFGMFGDIESNLFSFKYFIISRMVSGLGSGVSTAIVPTYLGEISPPIIRGEIGTLNAFMNAFGILFAEIIGFEYIFGTDLKWKYIFSFNIIPFFVQCLFVHSLCESPQWLLVNNNSEKAKQIFMLLRETDNVELDMRAIQTKRYYQQKSVINSPKINNNFNKIINHRKNSKTALLKDTNNAGDKYGATVQKVLDAKDNRNVMLYIFFITIFLQILQQFSGINSVWYYSSMILENAGLHSPFKLWIGNILIGSSNFFAVLIPVKLIEKLGRKKLIYLSCLGMIIASVALSMVLMFAKYIGTAVSGDASIIILIFYVISFAVGLGPIVGLLTVELSQSSNRGIVVSVAFFINYCANLFVAQYANVIVEYFYYLPFAAMCLFGCVFTYVCLIETKGRTETEIQTKLRYKVSRKYSGSDVS